MDRPKTSLLFHPIFLLCLVLLVLNDFYWKDEYHNWLTGKLSDFAGLIVLPVFCRVLWPGLSPKNLFLGCAFFFSWWKSPLSEPVILFLNTQFNLPVQRVVDYTDLFALLVIPFATRLQPLRLSVHPLLVRSLHWTLGSFTLFSLFATSMPYRHLFRAHPDMDDVYFHESITQKKQATAILKNLQAKGIAYKMDSVMFYPVVNQKDLFYKRPGNDSAWQQISQAKDSTLFVRWQGRPFYLIPLYQSGTKTFRNIRFTLLENKKKTKTVITVETFLADGLKRHALFGDREKKPYKEIFKQLFSEQ